MYGYPNHCKHMACKSTLVCMAKRHSLGGEDWGDGEGNRRFVPFLLLLNFRMKFPILYTRA